MILLAFPYSFDELTANGALGDATLASEELGQEIIEFLQDLIADDKEA